MPRRTSRATHARAPRLCSRARTCAPVIAVSADEHARATANNGKLLIEWIKLAISSSIDGKQISATLTETKRKLVKRVNEKSKQLVLQVYYDGTPACASSQAFVRAAHGTHSTHTRDAGAGGEDSTPAWRYASSHPCSSPSSSLLV